MDDGSLDDNVESFLSPDDADPRDRVGRLAEVSKGMMNVDFLFFYIPWHGCMERRVEGEIFLNQNFWIKCCLYYVDCS